MISTIEQIPLTTDADGVIRIGGTRVTLDTIVSAFDEGATAEEIAQQYSSLNLGDVYAVIGYYLRRRSEVKEYLQKRQQLGKEIREQNESHFEPRDVRERLLARRSAR
jgi:uncharacterized protein (DUF433 family)